MTCYQIPREETTINLTNISEQVYYAKKKGVGVSLQSLRPQKYTLETTEDIVWFM